MFQWDSDLPSSKWFWPSWIRGRAVLPACEWHICSCQAGLHSTRNCLPDYFCNFKKQQAVVEGLYKGLMHHLSDYSHTEGTYWLDFFQSPSDVLVPVLINNCSSSSSVLCILLHPVTFRMWGFSPGELWTESALPHPGLCSLLHLHPQHQESALRGLCKNSFCSQFPQLELQQVGILGRLWGGRTPSSWHHSLLMTAWCLQFNVLLQRRRWIHPEVDRVGQASTSDELHLYKPLPAHYAHHRTAGN